jgi:RNA 2',3'-cyclic 3'-phosphodiesterase
MAGPQAIRTFVCVEIPPEVGDCVQQLQQQLGSSRADVSWVKQTNLHFTLKFLGGISPAQIERVCEAVKRAAEAYSAFNLQLREAGCFPSEGKPRVLWVGLAEVPAALSGLYSSIDSNLSMLGFPAESRPFKPHLTLGRVRSPQDTRHTRPLVQAMKSAAFQSEVFRVSQVVVMKSELRRSGAIYSPIQTCRLKSG